MNTNLFVLDIVCFDISILRESRESFYSPAHAWESTHLHQHSPILSRAALCCVMSLNQWFSNLSWGPPTTAYFVCLPHLTHLIQLISSLVESARLELSVAYERDIQNMWWPGGPQDRFENHCSKPLALDSTVRVLHPFYNLD